LIVVPCILYEFINYYQQMHYVAIKITQITVFYVIIRAPTCVRHHTQHKQYTQLRYAATHLAINAFTFNCNLSTYFIIWFCKHFKF